MNPLLPWFFLIFSLALHGKDPLSTDRGGIPIALNIVVRDRVMVGTGDILAGEPKESTQPPKIARGKMTFKPYAVDENPPRLEATIHFEGTHILKDPKTGAETRTPIVFEGELWVPTEDIRQLTKYYTPEDVMLDLGDGSWARALLGPLTVDITTEVPKLFVPILTATLIPSEGDPVIAIGSLDKTEILLKDLTSRIFPFAAPFYGDLDSQPQNQNFFIALLNGNFFPVVVLDYSVVKKSDRDFNPSVAKDRGYDAGQSVALIMDRRALTRGFGPLTTVYKIPSTLLRTATQKNFKMIVSRSQKLSTSVVRSQMDKFIFKEIGVRGRDNKGKYLNALRELGVTWQDEKDTDSSPTACSQILSSGKH